MNMKIAICQINPTVGEISYNTNLICQNIISCIQKYKGKNGSASWSVTGSENGNAGEIESKSGSLTGSKNKSESGSESGRENENKSESGSVSGRENENKSESGSENKSEKLELLIIFPELAISGYPPEDLLYHPQWPNKIEKSLNNIQELAQKYNVHILVGHPAWLDNICINAASLISPENHKIIAIKNLLPNTGVFDERRYFTSQKDLELKSQENPDFFKKSNINNLPDNIFELNFESNKIKFGVLICEDGWEQDKAINLKTKGAEIIIQINASPFEINKANIRHQKALNIFNKTKLPFISVQLAGAQDELVFDGGSFAIKHNSNCTGEIKLLSPYFKEHIRLFELKDILTKKQPTTITPFQSPSVFNKNFTQAKSKSSLEPMEQIYLAIISSCKDYFQKNNFDGALIGLSGGIDSALTLALAVQALGPDKVEVILMPSKYTSNLSLNCARAQINLLKIKPENIKNINIDNIIATFTDSLKSSLDPGKSDKSCEANKYNSRNKELCLQNLQARARGMLLMAQSNLSGKLVLTTGNKSELAMGYSTLYGDMCGAYNLLKDLYKTQVYDLSKWINSKKMVIPNAIISRAPTAELAHDQKDEDSLPAYNILDPILIDIIENNKSKEQLVNQGHDPIILEQIFKAIKNSEYKRQQSPPGVKINKRAFGRDWRYPIKM